ncbi:hypothetical protein E2320_002334 [Naja naja]|nr:hypothetical protein E2320_002334 [Naja naja]
MVFDTSTALLAPQTVKAVSWENLQEVLSNHFSPKPSRIARWLAFGRRAQAEGESISSYMAALRTAALYCSFRYLDDMLLDQLVYGICDLQLQHCLLARSDLTLKLAIEESQAVEQSTLSAAEIQRSNPHTVNPAIAKASVHSEDASSEGIIADEEDIHRLKGQHAQQKRNWVPTNKPTQLQLSCLSCGGNHLRANC